MKLQPRIIFSFLSVLFLLASCEKDDSLSLYEDMGDGNLLKEVLIDGEPYYKYVYNEARLIVEEKSKFHYSKHSYNQINQLVQSDHYWDERIVSSSSHVLDELNKVTVWISPENAERDSYRTFEYDELGRLKKATTHRLANSYESVATYLCNEEGRIEKRAYYDSENNPSGYDSYFYDTVGNLIKKERYHFVQSGGQELQTTTEYEFDDHPNPYLSFRGLMTPGQNTNINNIVKDTYTLHFEVDDFIDKVQITEYDYKYNNEGYPTQKMEGWEFVYY